MVESAKSTSPPGAPSSDRTQGVTPSERYLQRLAERSFLRLWSYAGLYRDQDTRRGTSEGKELADLIVVFDEHVLVFSDKDCAFPSSGNLRRDWGRWYRRAVHDSAKQLFGAERWLLNYPERIFLDRGCTNRLPLELPTRDRIKIHRFAVAHNASAHCRSRLGGSGGLMIAPQIKDDDHWKITDRTPLPFQTGIVDSTHGFVHVLDDTSLELLLSSLDTISDFVEYIEKKEILIRSGKLLVAAGEEELLAVYLRTLGKDGTHGFHLPGRKEELALIDEGFWAAHLASPQWRAQFEANKISYAWDALIERFTERVLTRIIHKS